MKKTLFLAFLSIAFTLVLSCEKKEDLEEDSKNSDTTDTSGIVKVNPAVYNGTLADIPKDLDTAYMYLRTKRDVSMQVFSPCMLANMMSDDANCGGAAAEDMVPLQQIANFTATPSNPSIEGLYLKYFIGIHYLNRVLFNKELSKYQDSVKVTGEAKFLRAFMQFEMLKFFGSSPDFSKYIPLKDSAKFISLSTAETFNAIVKDLDAASKILPEKTELSDINKFRPTKGAALALLGKAYLYMASPFYNIDKEAYAKAKECFEKVINSNIYYVTINYNQFLSTEEFGSGSIFEIDYYSSGKWDYQNPIVNTGNPDPAYIGIRASGTMDGLNGWGFLPIRKELIDLYDSEKDFIRKKFTLLDCNDFTTLGIKIDLKYCYQYSGFYSNKYTYKASEKGNAGIYDFITNDRIIRITDVYLMYAEACFHIGDNARALQYVNIMKATYGLANLTNVNMDVIMQERRLELALEGHRFFDLVRLKLADQYLQSKGYTSMKSVFPIPQKVLNTYKNLKQNPGY